MNFEEFKNHCLSKKGVECSYPFKKECAWMKVMGKMFALANVKPMKMNSEIVPPFHFINLKCEPDRAILLRARYACIQPAWHQDKKHWNTIYLDGNLSDQEIINLVDESYKLVVTNLPSKVALELKSL